MQYLSYLYSLSFDIHTPSQLTESSRYRKISRKRRFLANCNYDNDQREQFFNEHISRDKHGKSLVGTGLHYFHYISSKDYARLKDNIICLTKPIITDEGKNSRLIHYEIASMGNCINYTRKNGTIAIHLEKTRRGVVIIAADEKELHKCIPKMESCKYSIDRSISHTTTNRYVLLAIICDYSRHGKYDGFRRQLIGIDDVATLNKTCVNQVRQQGKKHFGTCGKIYSFGYSAKYNLDQNGNSFGKYVNSK